MRAVSFRDAGWRREKLQNEERPTWTGRKRLIMGSRDDNDREETLYVPYRTKGKPSGMSRNKGESRGEEIE